ncbi:MBL fold metallo-hydrolase [Candidatus Peregrinibacteria bacterium]|nr:MAG: MBL fold metallo-hydrolase [Candidatus Peregrinibacteria bacterium]
MKIKFHGHACFSIEDKNIAWVTDPFQKSIVLSMPKLTATMVTESLDASEAHNAHELIGGTFKRFNWPGEYETMGVHVKGVSTFHNSKEEESQLANVVFVAHLNGINVCHLGALGTKLSSEHLEKIGDIDVLMVPVGGKNCIDAKKAKEVVEQIEPRVVIPMMYDTEGSNQGLAPVTPFLSEMGAQSAEHVDSFTFKKGDLPEDTTKVVVLNRI